MNKSFNSGEKIDVGEFNENLGFGSILREKTNLLNSDEVLIFLENFKKSIEKNYLDYSFLKENFEKNSELFKRLVYELRSVEPNTMVDYENFGNNEKYFKKKLNLDEHLYPAHASGFGDCLWFSLSTILFGSEAFFFLVKLCSIHVLFEEEEYFKALINICEENLSIRTFICNSCKLGEYARVLNILSSSIMLRRKIFSYNVSNNPNLCCYWKFDPEHLNSNSSNPITIGLVNEHFFPIFSSLKEYKQFKQHNELNFLDFFGRPDFKDLLKTYK